MWTGSGGSKSRVSTMVSSERSSPRRETQMPSERKPTTATRVPQSKSGHAATGSTSGSARSPSRSQGDMTWYRAVSVCRFPTRSHLTMVSTTPVSGAREDRVRTIHPCALGRTVRPPLPKAPMSHRTPSFWEDPTRSRELAMSLGCMPIPRSRKMIVRSCFLSGPADRSSTRARSVVSSGPAASNSSRTAVAGVSNNSADSSRSSTPSPSSSTARRSRSESSMLVINSVSLWSKFPPAAVKRPRFPQRSPTGRLWGANRAVRSQSASSWSGDSTARASSYSPRASTVVGRSAGTARMPSRPDARSGHAATSSRSSDELDNAEMM